jgi:ABC-type transporter MlaC component
MPAARVSTKHLLGRESIIFGSKEQSAMSRIHLALLTVGALVIASAALITWRRHENGSPLESLQQLANAVRAKDRAAIERYLDVGRTAESVVDEAISTAGDPALKPSLVTALQQSIWTALLDSLATLEGRYQGLAGVEQRGDVARVGVRIRSEEADSAFVVHLRMERAAGGWRVVGVEDLGPYLQASLGRRQERAYEAAMRSDLRNLATAQEIYLSGHATYSASLQDLTYSPSPGVRLEIIVASGTGWRAVAHHETGTAECRIGVGTGALPGDAEREVKCSAPRRREIR